MNTKFSFGRVYTLLYYLIVLPVSILLILALLLSGFVGGIFKEEHFVFNNRSELFSYYLVQIFHIKNYLLCIPIFLLTTIFLTPKHFNLKKFLVINIIGVILLTLYFAWAFYNTLSNWDKLTNVTKGMNNIRYELFRSSSPDVFGYQCVSFDIESNQKLETRNLITERIKNINSNLVFNYKIGQQTIYDANLLDTIKNDLRGSVCR